MKSFIVALLIVCACGTAMSQPAGESRIPFLGEMAPAFVAESTRGKIKFPEDYFNKWRIILSHPGAFTPVCTSELIEYADLQDVLKKHNAELIVISADGVSSNNEWLKSIETLTYKGKKPAEIKFPIVSDQGFAISKQYGMQHLKSNSTKSIRGVFIVDPGNKIRLIEFYPSEIGRSTHEMLRALIALQESDNRGVLTPANWQVGDDFLIRPPKNMDEFEDMRKNGKETEYYLNWYMWFQKY
ncbi:MAG: redoxin domain-containing protein [Lentimicrobiaceae bacterium]|nr:redoxin domain-containing protein [Lentimicrobiaceae bacterium]